MLFRLILPSEAVVTAMAVSSPPPSFPLCFLHSLPLPLLRWASFCAPATPAWRCGLLLSTCMPFPDRASCVFEEWSIRPLFGWLLQLLHQALVLCLLWHIIFLIPPSPRFAHSLWCVGWITSVGVDPLLSGFPLWSYNTTCLPTLHHLPTARSPFLSKSAPLAKTFCL